MNKIVKNAAEKLVKSVPEKLQRTGLHSAYITLMNNYIDYQISVFNVGEALAASDEIQELVEKQANKLSLIVYYFNRILICLYTDEHRKASYAVNKVSFQEKTGLRGDVVWMTKILSLVVHYELENHDILSSLCASYTRYFNNASQENKGISVLLHFFGKTIYKKSEKEKRKVASIHKSDRINLFTVLKKELEACKIRN